MPSVKITIGINLNSFRRQSFKGKMMRRIFLFAFFVWAETVICTNAMTLKPLRVKHEIICSILKDALSSYCAKNVEYVDFSVFIDENKDTLCRIDYCNYNIYDTLGYKGYFLFDNKTILVRGNAYSSFFQGRYDYPFNQIAMKRLNGYDLFDEDIYTPIYKVERDKAYKHFDNYILQCDPEAELCLELIEYCRKKFDVSQQITLLDGFFDFSQLPFLEKLPCNIKGLLTFNIHNRHVQLPSYELNDSIVSAYPVIGFTPIKNNQMAVLIDSDKEYKLVFFNLKYERFVTFSEFDAIRILKQSKKRNDK